MLVAALLTGPPGVPASPPSALGKLAGRQAGVMVW